MFANFDKKQLQKKFSNQACSYADAAQIQFSAAQKLCQLTKPFLQKNHRILDLGAGTGFVAQNLAQEFELFEIDISWEMLKQNREKSHFKIQADIENLPFAANSFDAIISSFSMQWLTDFDKSFQQFFKILKPSGILAFCLPVAGSLQELKVGNFFNFNQLPSEENLIKSLENSGFKKVLSEKEKLKEFFENGTDAIKSLKKIGANYSEKNHNIITQTKLKQFNNFCLKNFDEESRKISVTWITNYLIFTKQ